MNRSKYDNDDAFGTHYGNDDIFYSDSKKIYNITNKEYEE